MTGDVDRSDPSRDGARATIEDVRAIVGGATPHFALQIRDRVKRLIEPLDADDPARREGERAIARLERLARTGVTSGPVQEHEVALPSLLLERDRHGRSSEPA